MVYEYDLDGDRLHQSSVDSGEVWVLDDAAGRTIRSWTAAGSTGGSTSTRSAGPPARPPHRSRRGATKRIVIRLVKAGDSDNLRLQIQQVFDSAGTLDARLLGYHFKGQRGRHSARTCSLPRSAWRMVFDRLVD